MTSLTSLVFKPTALLLTNPPFLGYGCLCQGGRKSWKLLGKNEQRSSSVALGSAAQRSQQMLWKKIEYFEDVQFVHCNLQREIYIDLLVSSSKVWLFQISSVSGGRFGARRLQLSDCRNWSKLFGWIAVDLGTQTSAGSTFCRPLSDCSIYIYIHICWQM